MTKFWQSLAGLKASLSFILHVLGLCALYAMSLRGVDTSTAIVGLVFSYGGTQTAKMISAHVNASRDPESNTLQAIRDVDSK